ncbi:hypothetical protein BU15DRAFT_55201, partial [Melanogaster broomeanus]
KFELERLEQSYRSTTATEYQAQAHIESLIKMCMPAILNHITAYNKLCDDIHAMIHLQKAPQTAVPLLPIQCDNLFKVNIYCV